MSIRWRPISGSGQGPRTTQFRIVMRGAHPQFWSQKSFLPHKNLEALDLEVIGVGGAVCGDDRGHLGRAALGGDQFEPQRKIIRFHPAAVGGAPGVFVGGGAL